METTEASSASNRLSNSHCSDRKWDLMCNYCQALDNLGYACGHPDSHDFLTCHRLYSQRRTIGLRNSIANLEIESRSSGRENAISQGQNNTNWSLKPNLMNWVSHSVISALEIHKWLPNDNCHNVTCTWGLGWCHTPNPAGQLQMQDVLLPAWHGI